jgi:hypothetical protein
MTNPNAPVSRRESIVLAAILALAGIFVAYSGATQPPGFHAPPWVAYLLALIFIGAAVRVLEMASGRAGRGDWFGFVFCAAAGITFVWIPIGGDPRQCTGSIGGFGFRAGNLCQGTFGVMGVLLIAVAIYIAWRSIRRRPEDGG